MNFAQQLLFADGVEDAFIRFFQCGDNLRESGDLSQFGYVVDVIFAHPGTFIVNTLVEVGL